MAEILRFAQDDNVHGIVSDEAHPEEAGERFASELTERDGDERVAALAPGIQTALQWADALDAILPEEQRHTGAGGFVRSSTVENYFAVAGQKVILLFQFLGVHAESAGNGFRVSFEVHRMA